MDGDNKVECARCKKKRTIVKSLTIFKCPEVLVLHIKRFQFTSIVRQKLSTSIHFPISSLDISPFLSPDSPQKSSSCIYDLVGVSNHMGGMGGGHYTATVDSSFGNSTWNNYDDSHASQTTPSSSLGSSAYLLFYKKRDD